MAIEDGIRAGRNPRSIALDLVGRRMKGTRDRMGGIVGLHSRQAATLRRAEANLRSGDPTRLREYLRLAHARDTREGAIQKAIDGKERLSAERIRQIIADHRARSLYHRGEVIARTETLTALRAGQFEGYAQIVDTGAVAADRFEKTWTAIQDGRVRDHHMSMAGQVVRGLFTPFVGDDGSRMLYPGDRSLGATGRHTIQCRCSFRIRILSNRYAEAA